MVVVRTFGRFAQRPVETETCTHLHSGQMIGGPKPETHHEPQGAPGHGPLTLGQLGCRRGACARMGANRFEPRNNLFVSAEQASYRHAINTLCTSVCAPHRRTTIRDFPTPSLAGARDKGAPLLPLPSTFLGRLSCWPAGGDLLIRRLLLLFRHGGLDWDATM